MNARTCLEISNQHYTSGSISATRIYETVEEVKKMKQEIVTIYDNIKQIEEKIYKDIAPKADYLWLKDENEPTGETSECT